MFRKSIEKKPPNTLLRLGFQHIAVKLAIYVPKEGATIHETDILTYCKAHLSSFKAPKHVRFRDTLPKNPSGKILKRALRTEHANPQDV